jgi:hypothetical protein
VPHHIREQLDMATAASIGGSVMGFITVVAIYPVFVVMSLFLSSAITHLFLMLVGALGDSRAGYEGTFRVTAYAQVANVALVVPVMGMLVSIVWWVVLEVIGLAIIHRTTQGKALFAVLIPTVCCCACFLLFIGALLALVIGVFAGK